MIQQPQWIAGSPIRCGQSVILCGNGPSMTESGDRGAAIDQFEVVVRFNRYAIRGFERQVGTRTSLWSTFGRGTTPMDAGEVPEAALYIHGERAHALPIKVPVVYGVPRTFFDRVRIDVQTRSQIAEEKRKAALLPSSGLVVALWLLECGASSLTLAGFDHFQKDRFSAHHYWQKKAFHPPAEHDGAAEAEWFGELVGEGKVGYL